jgi:hypothetical protein
MTVQFRNLVFEGGGVKDVAYVGAMQILQNRGFLSGIQRVGGTSAGAINALISALGYSIAEHLGEFGRDQLADSDPERLQEEVGDRDGTEADQRLDRGNDQKQTGHPSHPLENHLPHRATFRNNCVLRSSQPDRNEVEGKEMNREQRKGVVIDIDPPRTLENESDQPADDGVPFGKPA